ncbi:hypothetical protein Cni_G12513 [Canna indica]|uniref:Uncharacterized protein n=1 Tax=Canna indica TaxID=4628 RepID=A0AAQ3QC75_9LILI|nr:hypothetical protein Cni_G12513 [Canna indica]
MHDRGRFLESLWVLRRTYMAPFPTLKINRVLDILRSSGHVNPVCPNPNSVPPSKEPRGWTTLVWSHSTGLPLYNAIVWMDEHTTAICYCLIDQFHGARDHFIPTCGLSINTYFSAIKLL